MNARGSWHFVRQPKQTKATSTEAGPEGSDEASVWRQQVQAVLGRLGHFGVSFQRGRRPSAGCRCGVSSAAGHQHAA